MLFDSYLVRWNLTPDGAPITTHSGSLMLVRREGAPAMLKVAREADERWGAGMMVWWAGEGATGEASLSDMERNGRDDEASRIICAVAARLHAPRNRRLPEIIPLARWFQDLEPAALRHGAIPRQATATARELLADPQDVVVLHGDLHHGNILDFGPRGWLAIDPKRLLGDRGFGFANIFCNPDLATTTAPERLSRQASVVADAAGIDRARLLKWIVAYAGLSAACGPWAMVASPIWR